MTRTILIATAVVAVAAIAYLTVVGTSDPVQPVAETRTESPMLSDAEAVAEENMSNRAASDAVERWTFNPATAGGRAIDSQIRVPVQFIAANSDAAPFVAPPGALDTIVLRAD